MPLHNEGLSKNDIEQQQLTPPLSKSIMEPNSPAENDTKPPSMHQPLHLASSTDTNSIMKGGDMNNVASVSFTMYFHFFSFLYFAVGYK